MCVWGGGAAVWFVCFCLFVFVFVLFCFLISPSCSREKAVIFKRSQVCEGTFLKKEEKKKSSIRQGIAH